jgi:hypothetical protein
MLEWRAVREEKIRLKPDVADRALNRQMLKEVNAGIGAPVVTPPRGPSAHDPFLR